MAAGRLNLIIEQGATFVHTLQYKQNNVAIDLTGYDARMQIRQRVEDASSLVSLTAGSGLSIVGATGTITITIAAVVTAGLSFDMAYYDLEIVSPGGVVTRLVEGTVSLSKEVTR